MNNYTFSDETIRSNVSYYTSLMDNSEKQLQVNIAMKEFWLNLQKANDDRTD